MTKSRCAVCGGNINTVIKQISGNEEYCLCSNSCKVKFLKSPDEFEKPWFYFRKHGIDSKLILCAVCGDNVPESDAVKQEHFDDKQLKHFFFCGESHRIEFIKNPKEFEENSGLNVSVK